MELASYLAGERWSDHPACTHPLLATVARLVNDHTSDAGRGRLVELVPSVIGLTSDDPHLDVAIALRSATTALPVAPAERQGVLAVSVLAAERVLADLDGRPASTLGPQSRRALDQVPHAAQWAQRFTQEMRATPKGFRRHAAPNIVRHAVAGIAQACVPDPDTMLHDLLAASIQDFAAWVPDRERVGAPMDQMIGHGGAAPAHRHINVRRLVPGRMGAQRRRDDLPSG